MQQQAKTELEALTALLPLDVGEILLDKGNINELIEIVMDLGRLVEARFLSESHFLGTREVSREDVRYIVDRVGPFGTDNRAGIERTLHRISAIRNRSNKIVGITLRVGRAVYGTGKIIEDLILTGKSVLLLGRPGVGKTTMLREVARVLADNAHRRVVVVDTSNEIAGDGDIPHPGIGRARRMQVPSPDQQHSVMIEAVENHMPEVIVIDEISTKLEANAARTIAERGVQLVATAHGNTLDNLILNPTLSDLVGGIQTVTLGDDEARRRKTQKTVLERQAPPTFDILVELQGWNRVAVLSDVSDVVDQMLRGFILKPQLRTMEEGEIRTSLGRRSSAPLVSRNRNDIGNIESLREPVFQEPNQRTPGESRLSEPPEPLESTLILPYGVNRGKLQQALKTSTAPLQLVNDIEKADLLLTTKSYYRRRTEALRIASNSGKPVYVLRKNTMPQIQQFVRAINRNNIKSPPEQHVQHAIIEANEAVQRIDEGDYQAKLNPQGAYIRHLQHQIAEERGFGSSSTGQEPRRSVVIYRR